MICILAGNHQEAAIWASGQQLSDDEWFFPSDMEELKRRTNYHVIVVGSAGQNVHPYYFENVYQTAKRFGRIGRR
jgi:hypothetical protein